MNRLPSLALAVVVSLLLSSSQVLLKQALGSTTNEGSLGMGSLLRTALLSWKAWAAVACTTSAAILWLKVIARLDFSLAYPLISLSYVFGLLGAAFLLHESIPLQRWIGVLVICVGVALINLR
jgi:multidrug transporter EmrE-like cation transporter